eukprot:GHVL01019646.1.p1 GENE.GHVL01019646.1~~GHVL01019646.1.p1  ORF type:complete len:1343 (-),score=297.01 GHVL01019646.1:39-3599(-)
MGFKDQLSSDIFRALGRVTAALVIMDSSYFSNIHTSCQSLRRKLLDVLVLLPPRRNVPFVTACAILCWQWACSHSESLRFAVLSTVEAAWSEFLNMTYLHDDTRELFPSDLLTREILKQQNLQKQETQNTSRHGADYSSPPRGGRLQYSVNNSILPAKPDSPIPRGGNLSTDILLERRKITTIECTKLFIDFFRSRLDIAKNIDPYEMIFVRSYIEKAINNHYLWSNIKENIDLSYIIISIIELAFQVILYFMNNKNKPYKHRLNNFQNRVVKSCITLLSNCQRPCSQRYLNLDLEKISQLQEMTLTCLSTIRAMKSTSAAVNIQPSGVLSRSITSKTTKSTYLSTKSERQFAGCLGSYVTDIERFLNVTVNCNGWLNLLIILLEDEISMMSIHDHKKCKNSEVEVDWIDICTLAFLMSPDILASLVRRFRHIRACQDAAKHIFLNHPIGALVSYTNIGIILELLLEENNGYNNHLLYWTALPFHSVMSVLDRRFMGDIFLRKLSARLLLCFPSSVSHLYIPQLVQSLRDDPVGIVSRALRFLSQRSTQFSHSLLFALQSECGLSTEDPKNVNRLAVSCQSLISDIIAAMSKIQRNIFHKQFRLCRVIMEISGILKPIEKSQRKDKIIEKLGEIDELEEFLYLPTNPTRRIVGLDKSSGTPLQSAAKVPILVSFLTEPWGGVDSYVQDKLSDDSVEDTVPLLGGGVMIPTSVAAPYRVFDSYGSFPIVYYIDIFDEMSLDDRCVKYERNRSLASLMEGSDRLASSDLRTLAEEDSEDEDDCEAEELLLTHLKAKRLGLIVESTRTHQIRRRFQQKFNRFGRFIETRRRDVRKSIVSLHRRLRNENHERGGGIPTDRRDRGSRGGGLFKRRRDSNGFAKSIRRHRNRGMKLTYLGFTLMDEPNIEPGDPGGDGGCGGVDDGRMSCIFKVNDDVRQDQLVLQIMELMRCVFEATIKGLWLFPYKVHSFRTGKQLQFPGGVIECVPNCMSRHQLGKKYNLPLDLYFETYFGPSFSTLYQISHKNFVQSLAGYCIISYLLQIKDRHNGNLLIKNTGHILHIDFGFAFEISPGHDIGFENAGFKLTKEMINIMGGSSDSETFKYFTKLTINGYLAIREYPESVISLVERMIHSGLPCFKPNTMTKLRKRLQLDKTPVEAALHMHKEIMYAYDNLRTNLYDVVQSIQQDIAY